MRELFDLSEKYGFKAPLVCAPDTLDLKVYLRLCGALSVSPTTIAVISDVFIALQDIDEINDAFGAPTVAEILSRVTLS